jgi:hypothetical protein
MPLACQVIVAAKHLGLDQGAVTHAILSAIWKDDLNIADVKDIGSALVISPFLTGCIRRIYAAIFSFCAGVMPPMPMLGRSLL